jgi:7,8-dihydropterin-6-yl-methyl-4-(beta-D-ribofuranosyl)aminobenzene 5'-phosphate synthase
VPSGVAQQGRTVDFLRAEHGFSALVEIRSGTRSRRVLFDAGVTPDGLIGNLDRLGHRLPVAAGHQVGAVV